MNNHSIIQSSPAAIACYNVTAVSLNPFSLVDVNVPINAFQCLLYEFMPEQPSSYALSLCTFCPCQ